MSVHVCTNLGIHASNKIFKNFYYHCYPSVLVEIKRINQVYQNDVDYLPTIFFNFSKRKSSTLSVSDKPVNVETKDHNTLRYNKKNLQEHI